MESVNVVDLKYLTFFIVNKSKNWKDKCYSNFAIIVFYFLGAVYSLITLTHEFKTLL
jgi:hypothetical protein